MRDKLIELLGGVQDNGKKYEHTENSVSVWSIGNEKIADYLLANGVIVPSFKIGDKVYQTDVERVYELDITDVYFYKKWIYETKSIDFDIDSIGKTVFLTKEEAEKVLAERSET